MNAVSAGYTIEENASLATHNTLRVAARARRLATLRDASRLPQLLDELGTTPLVLGQGSNVLFTGDYAGDVLLMDTHGVEVDEAEDVTRIAVAAGEIWDDFARWSLSQGFAGLENLILIPGNVGAAPIQNIGAYGVEVAEFIESIEAWDTQTGSVAMLDNAACAFGYRDSIFKRERDRYIVTAVRFALRHSRPLSLDYAGLRQEIARMGYTNPTPYLVAEAVRVLRTRKLPDPAVIGNAGSFFKNPVLPKVQAEAVLASHPDMPSWPVGDDHVKLSAGRLIETCGFKGVREGDAGISPRHALILINHGQASGEQLWALAQRVIDGVEQRFGIHLDPEPRIL
ncbi:MAG TPA: UDP-N-acetylmuramate dehydrogenase [Rhodanobacteraceae bacterium]